MEKKQSLQSKWRRSFLNPWQITSFLLTVLLAAENDASFAVILAMISFFLSGHLKSDMMQGEIDIRIRWHA